MSKTDSNESNSKEEQQQEERKFSKEQYERLERCSNRRDMTEWNKWRKENPSEDILLEKAPLSHFYLKGAYLGSTQDEDEWGEPCDVQGDVYLQGANLKGASLEGAYFYAANLQDAKLVEARLQGAWLVYANLRGSDLCDAKLQGATLWKANLKSANLDFVKLQGARFTAAIVDGATCISQCEINKHTSKEEGTDFRMVSIGNARISHAQKQLLDYNTKRFNWEYWYGVNLYRKHWRRLATFPVRVFWLMSDYGKSTGRVMATFFLLAIIFAVVYWKWSNCVLVNETVGDIRSFWHALYFSIVTMTTLGFGDIAANPDSWQGQTLLMVQVLLGYVLLGALVTRLAVLFTAGGPAGSFTPMDKKTKELLAKINEERFPGNQGN